MRTNFDDRAGPARSRRRQLGRLAVCLLLVFGAALAHALWRWRSLDDFVRAIDHGDRLFEDFLVFWRPAGRALLEGQPQPAGYYLTPTFALLMLPFGALQEETAIAGWGTLEALLALSLFLVPGLTLARRSPRLAAAYAVCFAFSVPLLHDWRWGQLSTLLTLLVASSLLLYRRGWVVGAAALLAFAITIKLYSGLFLVWFLVRGDRRFVGHVGLFVAAILLLPVAVIGWQRTLEEYCALGERLWAALPRVGHDTNSQLAAHVAHRWLLAVARRVPEIGPALPYCGFVVRSLGLVLLVACSARLARERRRTLVADLRGFALLWLCLPLVVETSWPHYFVYLPLVQTVLWAELWARDPGLGRSWLAAAIVASVVLASTPLQQALGAFRHGYLGLLLLADLLLLGVALVSVDATPRQRFSGIAMTPRPG